MCAYLVLDLFYFYYLLYTFFIMTQQADDDLEVEWKSVREALSKGYEKKGEERYLIADGWWTRWERYTNKRVAPPPFSGANADDPTETPTEHPGAIDNSPLINAATNDLKENLTEGFDFVAIPEATWDMLVRHYGISDKWPTVIKRRVTSIYRFSPTMKIEIYPLKLDVRCWNDLEKSNEISLSLSSTICEMESVMKKHFRISPETKMQIWFQKDKLTLAECVELTCTDDDLQKLAIQPDSMFLVETKSSNDWPSSKGDFINMAKQHGFSLQLTVKKIHGTAAARADSSITTSRAGLCGLQNLGNTCYMNSALQCLSNVPELTAFFRYRELYKSQLNKKNKLGTQTQLAKRYADLVEAIWSEKFNSVSPSAFKSTLGRFAPRFAGYAQHDASELLSFVLESLHEDLNRVTVKPYREIKDKDEQDETERGKEFWNYYQSRNDSKIVDLFHGQLKSTLRCNVCDKVYLAFDPFSYLSLPLPRSVTKRQLAHFRFADPNQPVATLCLDLATKFTARDLRQAFSEATGIEPKNIKMCSVFKQQTPSLAPWCDDDSRVLFVSSYDEILGFEVPTSGDGDWTTIAFLLRTPRNARIIPFIQPVAVAKMTSAEAHRRCKKLLKTTLKADVTYRLMHCGVSGIAQQEVPEDVDDDSEALAKKIVWSNTHYFLICIDDDSIDVSELSERPLGQDLDNKKTDDGVHLQECIKLFLTEEQLAEQDSWYCPQCKCHVCAFKKLDLWRLPPYLIIHLKRFSQSQRSYYVEKLDTFVKYPFELNVAEFLSVKDSDQFYDLIAVSNHFGSMGFGHYTAYALNATTKKWHLFDDSKVTEVVSENEVVSEAGYLLFYQRRTENC